MIEPGSIRTEWGAIAAQQLLAASGSGPYRAQAAAVAGRLANSSTDGAPMTSAPSVVAKTVVRAATVTRPKPRYAVGFGARPMITLHRLLPDRAFDAVIRRAFALPKP